MKRLILFLILLVLRPGSGAAQQRRALTVEDFITLDRPGEPTISPDGRWIAYTVTTTDLNANRRRSDLWLRAATGGAPPQKISTDSLGGRSARFSPDGTQIAYINSR